MATTTSTNQLKNNFFKSKGSKKTAQARLKLTSGTGQFIINKKAINDYFSDSEYFISQLAEPFNVVGLAAKSFDINAIVVGGGLSAQVSALKLALARALIELNPDLKVTLKKSGLLSRDSRIKERKKAGLLKARKQRQFTKR